ncbi:MAG TPA: LCP family protein [Gaiellaceae bacterium]|nr:LCP family protein [Gaiellaceae bacterium]
MAASGEKPYRVYKGGRTKGKVPLSTPTRERPRRSDASGRTVYRAGDGGDRHVVRRRRRGWTWKRWTWVTLLLLLVLLVVWSVAGFLAVRSGVQEANGRLPAGTDTALAKQNSLLLSSPTNILLLGTDHALNGQEGRSADRHSDSMMLLRTDPSRHRLTYLSIPRDLRASIPGAGEQKINAAMQIGGPKLAIQAADTLFGNQLQVNHVVVVDMSSFMKLVDAVGGIDVDVPAPILSNRFDCPYASQTRCQQWPGWRFKKGVQHMDGHRALIYSRIRENRLNPADTDISRGQRQQQVMQATLAKLASPGTFFRLPFSGSDLMKPLATDMSTWQFMQLGWVKFRAGSTLHCRLGGKDYGDGYITGDQENIAVVQMVLGNSAPQPPPPGSGLYGAGCLSR